MEFAGYKTLLSGSEWLAQKYLLKNGQARTEF
jgi:hypothetical protein